ncbi:hypothetical protein SAMN04487965_2051 [Microbulbifer donghaiensis]|uniref:DUF4175 domain-containing protein n=1 Tax=Microbulbifer donghaiensis TaxID=494016 RepID=A0A1M5B2Q6_9GAMM|nr:hypothetical protein [Microbulbifer donghaiensis]SHF36794.1 hypothetical protein SAMN04487965_2051 [Microbulbifer donghaiensis]
MSSVTELARRILGRAHNRWRHGSLRPYLWLSLPVGAAVAAGTAYLQWPSWLAVACVIVISVALLLDRNWRLSSAELCQRLDRCYPQMQDSSQLLRAAPETLAPLARLQRQRVATALQDILQRGELKEFRPAWHRSQLANAAGACLGLLLFVALDGLPQRHATETVSTTPNSIAPQSIAIAKAVTEIQPPAYTKLPHQTQALQVTAVEGARITWQIELDGAADGLSMLAAEEEFDFAPADILPSRRWQLTRTVTAADFYQLAVDSDGEQKLLPEIHNIEIQPDRAPEFSFDYPRDNVTVVSTGVNDSSALLQVSVEVADDFRVSDTELLITLASGSGENVRFRNDAIKLQPSEDTGKKKRYRFSIPVTRYDIEPGDELYWFLQARDNRAPQANVVKSQHFIVRWPHEEIFGLSDAEGMAIKVLPEYFRSQRQLIIDTEALLAEQEQLAPAKFRARAESLAYEQNLLRMRYGRFLGEEDSALEHGGDAHGDDTQGEHGADHAETHKAEHGRGQEAEHRAPPVQFGDDAGIVAAAGHQHGDSEHATLFDPQTKELLRSALNAMWSSWRELSVIEPRASLPHQHTALRFIKEVQQASRIYLQRVGFEPPPLDETRRLSGELDEVAPPAVRAAAGSGERAEILTLLQRVRDGNALGDEVVTELQRWPSVQAQPQLQLELSKALRVYRQQLGCNECRQQLTALLYQLLPEPLAQPSLPRLRNAGGEFDQWLQALQHSGDNAEVRR